MNKKLLLAGMALWFTLLGLGVLWATNPLARPPNSNLAKITVEQTREAFFIRLASLPPGKPSIVSHAKAAQHALEEGEPRPAVLFDYEEWAFRELRARLLLFFVLWVISGLLIHWLARRLSRERDAMA
jgi:hypothetical protein